MTHPRFPVLRLAVLLAACAPAAGCGKKAPPEQVTVEGKVVRADGKPVTGQVLILHPQEDVNKMSQPSAVLDEKDGTFRFDCLPGRYKVTLAPIPRQGHAPAGPGAAPGPGQVSTSTRPTDVFTVSPLEVDVPVGGTRDLVLTLKKR